jgi:hypothetical protein
MPKNKIRKKNGKKVKHTPKPTSISKTKMKKIMDAIAGMKENSEVLSGNSVSILEDSTGKMNILSPEELSLSGPELSNLSGNKGEESSI